MRRSTVSAVLFAILALLTVARADLPPEPGSSRVSVPLALETNDDLSDYRFFMESPSRMEEVTIQKGQSTVIGPEGHAGIGRIVTLWAIPKASITDGLPLSDPSKLEEVDAALRDGKVVGAVKLLTHSFQTTVSDEEKSKWNDPVYRITRENSKGLTATMMSERKANTGTSGSVTKSSDRSLQIAMIGGLLFVLAAVGFGLWLLRRASKNQAV